jgi:2-desacetyl-2-hydroxyethyl bacteriochlorophyllide A dehydrogenase
MECESLFFTGRGTVKIEKEEISDPGENQVLIKTLVSAISSGTEMLFYRGEVPDDITVDMTIPSLWGKLSYPLKYGYSVVGEVIDAGAGVSSQWKGKLIFAFHPHESYFNIPVGQIIPVPEHLTSEEMSFLPNMETAVNFLMDGQPMVGEKVVVFGQGVVGLLTTALLSYFPLTNLITVDPIPLRRKKSLELGASEIIDSSESDALTQLKSLLNNEDSYSGADLVYEISGNPDALNLAIAITGFNGRIVMGSWYGDKEVKLNLGRKFHRSRIRLISSQVSTFSPGFTGRWNKDRRLKTTMNLIEKIKPASFITHRIPFPDAQKAYEMIDKHPEKTIQVVLCYD